MSNARQIGEIEERVLSLSDILRSSVKEGDHSERARREVLCRFARPKSLISLLLTQGICRRLTGILTKLEPLSEQNGLLKFLRNEDHAGLLNGFIQDITQAVMDYQVCLETHSWALLTPAQTSLQQTTYENTKDILEVARDTHKISGNAEKATKDIAENTADIVRKAREIIVSVVRGTPAIKALMFLTGSHGPRNLGQTRPRA